MFIPGSRLVECRIPKSVEGPDRDDHKGRLQQHDADQDARLKQSTINHDAPRPTDRQGTTPYQTDD